MPASEQARACSLGSVFGTFFTGGGYAIFAGKEVARALGLMSLKEEDCSADLDGLSEKQLHTLHEWEEKFQTKYDIVGSVSSIELFDYLFIVC